MNTKESLQLSIVSNRVHGMPPHPPRFYCERKTFSPVPNAGFSNVGSLTFPHLLLRHFIMSLSWRESGTSHRRPLALAGPRLLLLRNHSIISVLEARDLGSNKRRVRCCQLLDHSVEIFCTPQTTVLELES